MPKNIFLMSFLYVFIACAMFIAATVNSTPTEERGMAASNRAVQGVHKGSGFLAGYVWQR